MLKEEIKKLIEKSIKELQKEGVFPKFNIPKIKIEHPGEENHGDYATNVAMVIVKEIKNVSKAKCQEENKVFFDKNSLEIANLIRLKIKIQNSKFFDKIEVVKPGFINFFLSKEYFVSEVKKILKEKDKYGSSKVGKGKTMVIDYSAPNIAKPFGVGHLRSTIIGQAIYNIYKFLGWNCIGDNHLGDWGTQFGKLIVAIEKWNKKELKDLTIHDLESLYVKFHQQAEETPELLDRARQEFKKLEQGDKEAKKIWQICVKTSLKEFDKIYKLLEIKIDYVLGESFYLGMLKEVIDETIKKNVAQKSEGALIIKYSENKLPPAMILKSDGATTYFARDLAAVKYRLKKWKPDLIIYEVGADQILSFKQLFQALSLLGWVGDEDKSSSSPFANARVGDNETRLFHVAHGLIRFKEGKFSTRKGKTIHLEEILEQAIDKAKDIIEKSGINKNFSIEEKGKTAKMVGIGGIKYNDLAQHYSKDIIFSWEKILNLKGNSSPYLQYTFARCQSVLRKVCEKVNHQEIKTIDYNLEEESILREIYKFPEIIEEAAESFSPNLICSFVFQLTQKYNLFYEKHPILTAETKQSKELRIALTAAVAQILKNSLFLLGISAPEKM